ncbi:MAG: helix-turn-helix domain-containing protein [Paracoccaceae bacterium]
MTPRRPLKTTDHPPDGDPDWAPDLPSIWDVADDEEDDSSDRLLPEDDPFAPPIPMAARRPDWHTPEAWITAERGAGRALAAAAEAVARLDERLRRAPEATRLAWQERLALTDVSTLLWAEGVRLRPETLALADADRLGRTEDEDQVIARALWARRRLMGQGALPEHAQDVAAFLGRIPRADAPEWQDLPEAMIPVGPDPAAEAAWCQAMSALADAHALTRSAAAFHLWRGVGLSDPGAWLEPGVAAARIAVLDARRGLTAAPLLAGSERTRAGTGGAMERLGTWLAGLTRAADHAQMTLDRIEAWQARAQATASSLKGKGAVALIELLAARPIVSAKDVAQALDLSAVQARTLLNRLHALGLTHELTGHSRFRFWTAQS